MSTPLWSINHVSESFARSFLAESEAIIAATDAENIERMAAELARVREGGGRLFVLGVGGSAAHASHAVNDFRKLCAFEAYAPTDNVSELSARTNDEGWDTVFSEWLRTSHLSSKDAVLALSVGGGDRERHVSTSLVAALELARELGASILGIVGRDGGFAARAADVCVVVPPLYPERVTPHTEAICSVICHLLVSHPLLQVAAARWESLGRATL